MGKDVYCQSEDESCLGMLQGCVEHEVCGGGTIEENTCFFWWMYDADPAGALRWARAGWLRPHRTYSPPGHAGVSEPEMECWQLVHLLNFGFFLAAKLVMPFGNLAEREMRRENVC